MLELDKIIIENGIKYVVQNYNNKAKYYYKFETSILHREDGPAIEYANGTKIWYKEGQYHREDGPAAEYFDGSKEWYKEGKLHREDGPAVELINERKEYWLNNEFLKDIKSNEELMIKLLLE